MRNIFILPLRTEIKKSVKANYPPSRNKKQMHVNALIPSLPLLLPQPSHTWKPCHLNPIYIYLCLYCKGGGNVYAHWDILILVELAEWMMSNLNPWEPDQAYILHSFENLGNVLTFMKAQNSSWKSIFRRLCIVLYY